MPTYRFAIRDTEADSENLGGMELLDDATAIAFGNGVMRDLMHGGAKSYIGSILDITQDARAVGSVSFK
jgi:hypothetical protein